MDFMINYGMYLFVIITTVALAIAVVADARKDKNRSVINVYNLYPDYHYDGVVYCLS